MKTTFFEQHMVNDINDDDDDVDDDDDMVMMIMKLIQGEKRNRTCVLITILYLVSYEKICRPPHILSAVCLDDDQEDTNPKWCQLRWCHDPT